MYKTIIESHNNKLKMDCIKMEAATNQFINVMAVKSNLKETNCTKKNECAVKDSRIAFLEGKIEGMLEMHKIVVESLNNRLKKDK